MMKHKVGQVVFILQNKKMSVVPVQVIEEVIRKTLKGEEVTYKVRLGSESSAENKVYDLATVDGVVYTDIEKLKNDLFENALKNIEQICESAKTKSKNWYVNSVEIQQVTSLPPDVLDEHDIEEDEVADGAYNIVEIPGIGPAKVRVHK